MVLRKEGLFGSLKRNQLISMSITGTKVSVLSGSKQASVPLAVGGRFYVVAVSVSSDAVTVGLLSTDSVTSSSQNGQLWASLNFFFDKELIERGDVSRIYPAIDEWLLPEGTGPAPSPAVPVVAAQPISASKSESAAKPISIQLHPGMARKELVSTLGNPLREITFGDRSWLQYPGLTAVFAKDSLTSVDTNTVPAKVTITSEPEGAEIYVDGGLAGSTPSTLSLPAGACTIKVKQAGFQDWQRDLRVLAGSEVSLRATLSK